MRVVICSCLVLAVSVLTGVATAQPVVDGTKDVLYGSALAVQTVQTEFGDNGDDNGTAKGSELNAAYAAIDSGKLYLMLTGNLEDNFNKLEIFIDSVAGGENVLGADTENGGTNPTNDGWASGTGTPEDNLGMAGMTFDAGFEADYLLIARNGFSKFDFDYSVIGGGGDGFGFYEDVFGGTTEGAGTASGTPTAGTDYGFAFDLGFDNSNVAGVEGGTEAADPNAALAVTTGIELGIPLAALGNPGGDVKVLAFVNGDRHTYASNQFLGGLEAPQKNLGSGNVDPNGDPTFNGSLADVDLNNYNGIQYFTVPNSLVLGDVNGDGEVNDEDVAPFQEHLLNGPYLPAADMNQDLLVNGLDVQPFRDALAAGGELTARVQGVPEPSGLALALATGLLSLAASRRRRRGSLP